MALILLLNSVLNFWNLSINGWANSYYTAAVQSGTRNPISAFFGSSDWANSITVDKPPLSLWVMEISAWMFGFTPISILAPQALIGVLSTLLIYVIIRRNYSSISALIAAVVFFTTPVVTLMSRYNNPDPLMLLLMLLAIYFMQLAVTSHQTKFILLTAIALGLAFMTKQIQGLLVLPSIAFAYFCWTRESWQRRIRKLLAAATVLAITGGLWMVIVDLVPPHLRPYIGGSPSNSVLELTLAYNGVDRVISKDEAATVNMVPEQFRPVDSDAGFARLLNANYGQEIGWLLVCGAVCTFMVLFMWRKMPASTGARATAFIAVSWFLVTFLVLSFMGDQIHTYYTAALAPPLSLAIGVASDLYVKHHRTSTSVRLAFSGAVLTAAASSWLLFGSVSAWAEWLPTGVICAGALGAAMLAGVPPNRGLLLLATLASASAALAGPVVTSWHNVTVSHTGSNPVSGAPTKNASSVNRFLAEMQRGEHPWAYDLAFGQKPRDGVIDVLVQSSGCTWAAATYASQTAARLQIESGRPVMPVGGFAGTDPSPTVSGFISKVENKQICYFLPHEDFLAAQAEPSSVVEITSWVKENFESKNVEGQILYDLRNPR